MQLPSHRCRRTTAVAQHDLDSNLFKKNILISFKNFENYCTTRPCLT